MMLKSFELLNFRGISRMPLTFTSRTTAFLGVNGVGKSSVLDALAIALSSMTERIVGQASKARDISPDDIQNGQDFSRLIVSVNLDGAPTSWAVARNRKAGKHTPERSSDFEALNDRTGLLNGRMLYRESNQLPINLPLAVYYDVHRAVLDVPLRVKEKLKNTPREAYNDALGHGGTDFRGFFAWFRDREDAENERIRDVVDHRDRDLMAVRAAIEAFTKFTDLRIRRKPTLRMTVKKEDAELNVLQLSDGEKCLLALVGDLARRLSLLNTERDNPLEGEGIVLIDEIDLHLHPKWQRTVVASLERTFPNCQFIITTHSPQIVGELRPNQIFLLHPQGYGHPQVSYGLDSSRVLEEIMGASERSAEVENALSELFAALERNELESARAQLKILTELAPGIAEIGGAHALLKRKEVVGR